ncbi:uncharacterized protein [Coffea arabica]|uniref:Uncharacterized protein n=1 Tax=Coffea arabica TaxID=13443 RepID=A0ABM4U2D0_COFAR
MPRVPLPKATDVVGLLTKMKLEIVQSGKIPKNQALLVYNRNLKTEEEARKEDDANLKDAEAAKFAEDPVEEFKAAARREIKRDKMLKLLVAVGILESTSSAVAGVRVAIQKGPVEGPVELTNKLLGYSKRNRSLEQRKRVKQIVAVREYLQELVKNQAAKKSGGPHVVRARGGE